METDRRMLTGLWSYQSSVRLSLYIYIYINKDLKGALWHFGSEFVFLFSTCGEKMSPHLSFSDWQTIKRFVNARWEIITKNPSGAVMQTTGGISPLLAINNKLSNCHLCYGDNCIIHCIIKQLLLTCWCNERISHRGYSWGPLSITTSVSQVDLPNTTCHIINLSLVSVITFHK